MLKRPIIVALVIAPLVALSGCGGSIAVPVKGKVLKDGAAYSPPKGEIVYVTFYESQKKNDAGKTVQSGQPYQAKVDQTNGTFALLGPKGQGLPPGKYRVAVTQKMTREAFDEANPKHFRDIHRDDDILKDQFGPETSTIFREVKTDEEVTIDLDKEKPNAPPIPANTGADNQ